MHIDYNSLDELFSTAPRIIFKLRWPASCYIKVEVRASSYTGIKESVQTEECILTAIVVFLLTKICTSARQSN